MKIDNVFMVIIDGLSTQNYIITRVIIKTVESID